MALTVLQVAYPLAPVGPDVVGGAEQVLSTLDRALTAAGHTSIVVAQEGSDVAGTLVPVPAERGPFTQETRVRAWGAHRLAIARALERYPVDVVHLHGHDFTDYWPEDVPTLVTLHLPPEWYPPGAWVERRTVFLHPVSKTQAKACPPGVKLLDPVPNGVPVAELTARHAKRTFALNMGRICPEKGVHLAIAAAKEARSPLLVAGKTYPYAAHQSYFAREVRPALDGMRRFIGPLDFRRKRRFMTAARCLLVPSLAAETSSLVAMEAMACGTPVIAFRAGALAEIVVHGRTGFLVSDAKEMAAAIDVIDVIDPEDCRAVARQRFSMAAMVAGMMDHYRMVMMMAALVDL
jgi:glycosyltransferase involved in cell wall biosynthesis